MENGIRKIKRILRTEKFDQSPELPLFTDMHKKEEKKKK